MSKPVLVYEIRPDDRARIRRHPEWGRGEVLRVPQSLGVYQAKVLFKAHDGERVENLPIELLEKTADLWERLAVAGFRAEAGTGAGRSASEPPAAPEASPDAGALARRLEAVKNGMILDWVPDRYRRARVTSQLVGLHRQ